MLISPHSVSARGSKLLRFSSFVTVATIMVLHGCSTQPVAPPRVPPPPHKPAPVAVEPTPAPVLSTPPAPAEQMAPPPSAPACACPEAATPKSAEAPRGKMEPATWDDLPGWGSDPLAPSLAAFLQSCSVLDSEPDWKTACAAAAKLPAKTKNRQLREFFERNFTPHHVVNGDGTDTGMITGYYEPLLFGSRTKTDRYRYPLYSPPDDLLTIDLSSVYPELKNKRLRGRLEGNRVVPYLSRADIETTAPPLQGKELVWVDDAIDAFFLQIQGSGQVKLDNGDTMRVGYADQNGHPFRSVARYLVQKREMRLEQTSMQGLKAWARANPDKLDAFLNFNPSYVFFKELPLNLPGPIGTLGVPLTAERSVAVDQRVVPLGVPVYLATTFPNTKMPLNRLMVAQDTGGAINGAVRADFFWGFGDEAGKVAGVMKQSGRMWVLLPKGYSPPVQPLPESQ